MHPAIRKDGVAVITGAAAGIGNAIAQRLAHEGMQLALLDKDGKVLDAAVRQLRASVPGVKIQALAADVTDESARAELQRLVAKLGEAAVLVNNAGVMRKAGPWENSTQWRQLMQTNFWSTLALQELFVPDMLAQAQACAVINVGSKEGITTPPGNAAYAVSKAALRVLTEQLAFELRSASNGRVSAHLLIPGYTFTPMNFPGMTDGTPKPDAPWSAAQVADRMVARMGAGSFYLFCEDNEVTRRLDQRRMQWSADDLILDRPALSRWLPEYREEFTRFVSP